MHLERRLYIPLMPAVVEIDLNDLDSHHADHAFDEVENVEGGADERDDCDAYESAIKSKILKPVYELFLIFTKPAVLGAFLIEFADDQVGHKEQEGQY